MKKRLLSCMVHAFGELPLHRKIRLSLMLVLLPLFFLFVLIFFSIYHSNLQYDRIIENASEAGRFSIDFKEEFDYKIYLLIAGHSTFEKEDPYTYINESREITSDLIKNTHLPDNKRRAESIMKLLGNLEEYVRQIEENKRVGGHYDENIDIWENYVQLVTALVQTTVLEYTYYETKGMETVREHLADSLSGITLAGLIVFALLVLAALLMSVLIPNSIARPIHHLNEVTNQVAKGDLSVRANVLHGAEVKHLGESLNVMIEKIENLLQAIKTDQTNLREAELELLQAQINPHFLYNTLDTIIWLAEAGRQGAVVEIVGSLSAFFRTSLNHGNGMVTLREEERHVRSYLQIQKVRYQDILEYEIEIPERLMITTLPKITLQPLVENALYHGIKNRRGRGRIAIRAVSDNGDAVLSVRDNGAGIHPDRLEQIAEGLNSRAPARQSSAMAPKRDSYGLYNVNERIKLKFGEQYGLTITSTMGEGTCVSVRIPIDGEWLAAPRPPG